MTHPSTIHSFVAAFRLPPPSGWSEETAVRNPGNKTKPSSRTWDRRPKLCLFHLERFLWTHPGIQKSMRSCQCRCSVGIAWR